MSSGSKVRIDIVFFPLECDAEKRLALNRLLSEDETRRAARFRFDKHRNRFITGRGSIREILADRGKCRPREIGFESNQYGKPVVDRPGFMRKFQFNASSSETLGGIAISNGIPLGLDIEKINPANRRDYDSIVKNELATDEYAWYQKHADSDRIRAFFELWTCKEAYLKALGVGLSARLDSFAVNLDGNEPRVSQTSLEPGGKSELSLQRLDIGDGYLGCLALPVKASRVDLSWW